MQKHFVRTIFLGCTQNLHLATWLLVHMEEQKTWITMSWLGKTTRPREVIKLFSCLTQLSMKFFLLVNVKMPTIVGILTFMSWTNNIMSLPEPKKSQISWWFYTYEHLKFHAQLSWAWKSFITPGPMRWRSARLDLRYIKHAKDRTKLYVAVLPKGQLINS